MANEQITLEAKLKLDTSEAEQKLDQMSTKQPMEVALPKDTKIKLPKDTTKGLKDIVSSDKGLKGLGRVAKSAMGGVQGLLNGLQGVSSTLTKGGGLIGLIIAIISLLVKLAQGTDTWKKMTQTFQEIWDAVGEALASNIALIGESLMQTMEILKEFLPLLDICAMLFDLTVTPLVELLFCLKPLFELIGGIVEVVATFVDLIGGTLLGIMNSLFSIFNDLVGKALQPVIRVLDKVVDAFEWLKGKIQEFVTFITLGAIQFDNSIATTTGKKVGNYKTSLDVWQTSGDKVSADGKAIKGSVESAAEGVQFILQEIADNMRILVSDLTSLGDYNADLTDKPWRRDMAVNYPYSSDNPLVRGVIDNGAISGLATGQQTQSTKQELLISVDKSSPAGPRELAQWVLPSLKFALK